MTNYYYYVYDLFCEFLPNSHNSRKKRVKQRTIIVNASDITTAQSMAEEHVRKRPLYNGNLDEYHLVLTHIDEDVGAKRTPDV